MREDFNLELLTISSARTAVQERQVTATALVEKFYRKIEAEDSKPNQVNAYLTLTRERALKQAKALDELADRGEPLPPLGGVPIGIKDVIVTKGVRTTAGSKMLRGYVPPYDSTAVVRLEQAGAIVLGKVNCDEFAMGSSTENSAWGPVRNPRDLTRVPGGSSGGSAACVAAGTAVAALGSDTGGSIRQPAAFCGVVGLMPTYGRVSRYGLIAFGSSLDHIGPVAKSAKDAAILLRHLAGHDPMDTTSAQAPVPDYELEIGKPVRGLRIGVPREYFPADMDPEVRQSVEAGIQRLGNAGCVLKSISLSATKYAIPTYYVIATAEASSNLARYDGVRYGYRSPDSETLAQMYRRSRDDSFGPEVKRRIMLGTYALSAGYYEAYYLKAQKVRTLIVRDFGEAFKEVDVIITPTTPTPAFKLGEKSDNPVSMYLADIFTVTASLAGIPGVSVPCGESQTGLPIGMQILGRHFEEGTILRVAHALEHARASSLHG
jgi:aspartyl-tRNA(Asn)/glutamyl-tRNA(Gln) amidotransferase subunit A